jgi:hypothetical protein
LGGRGNISQCHLEEKLRKGEKAQGGKCDIKIGKGKIEGKLKLK